MFSVRLDSLAGVARRSCSWWVGALGQKQALPVGTAAGLRGLGGTWSQSPGGVLGGREPSQPGQCLLLGPFSEPQAEPALGEAP